jgi:prepilin-type N-terminal cleavage/methylation domain-containing protein/prepilin-type processing-associated H-X9-DG protein
MHIEKKGGFTLVELLVVIAVIAVIAGMLGAALGPAKARAHATMCLNNMRQIGLAAALYSNDHDDQLPGSSHSHHSWIGTLEPDSGKRAIYRCPQDDHKTRVTSYAINDYCTTHPYGAETLDYSWRSRHSAPSETIFVAEAQESQAGVDHFHFADSVDGGYSPAMFQAQVDVTRHFGSANYLFVDGHVEARSWTKVSEELVRIGSRFVNPEGHS